MLASANFGLFDRPSRGATGDQEALLPLRLIGRASDFESDRLGSSPRGGTKSDERPPYNTNPLITYQTAVHEAGHALMAVRRGVVARFSTIIPGNGGFGSTLVDVTHNTKPKMRDAVFITVAGWAACAAKSMPSPDFGCYGDFDAAKRFLKVHGLGDDVFADMRTEALKDMREYRNRRAVDTLVEAFSIKSRLEEYELHRVVGLSDAGVGGKSARKVLKVIIDS